MADPADELRVRVRHACTDAPPPAYGDIFARALRARLAGQSLELALHYKHWSQVARDTLDAHRDSVFTLSAAAYRAYVPAFLLACLDGRGRARDRRGLCYDLHPLAPRGGRRYRTRAPVCCSTTTSASCSRTSSPCPTRGPPTEPVDDQLRACIHRAFAHVRPLAADDLLQPRYARSGAPGAVAHTFRGAAWAALPVGTLRAHADVMFAFSGAGSRPTCPASCSRASPMAASTRRRSSGLCSPRCSLAPPPASARS